MFSSVVAQGRAVVAKSSSLRAVVGGESVLGTVCGAKSQEA